MTALSNVYTIRDYNSSLSSGALLTNDKFVIVRLVAVVDNQSTLVKRDVLSGANRLELQKIKDFVNLEEDWDSYDAIRISPVAIEKAQNLIKSSSRFNEDVYFSSPGPNGEVMVQLRKGTKEIEFIFYEASDKFVTFHNNEFSKQGKYSEAILPDLIEWLNMHE